MKYIAIRAALAALFVLPVHVSAKVSNVGAQQHEVRYAGLDLRSRDGVAMLDARILRAVRTVCGHGHHQTLTERMAVRKCQAEAMQTARHQVDLAVAKANERYAGSAAQVAIVTVDRKGF